MHAILIVAMIFSQSLGTGSVSMMMILLAVGSVETNHRHMSNGSVKANVVAPLEIFNKRSISLESVQVKGKYQVRFPISEVRLVRVKVPWVHHNQNSRLMEEVLFVAINTHYVPFPFHVFTLIFAVIVLLCSV